MELVRVLHVVPEVAPSEFDHGFLELLARLDRRLFDVRVAVVSPELAPAIRSTFAAAAIPILHHRVRQLAGPSSFAQTLARSRVLADMRRLFHATRPQIAHTHGTWLNVHAGLAARLAGVPHLMSHDHDLPTASWHERLLARWAARLSEVIFVDSAQVAAARRALLGSAAERVLTLPLGVDLARFQRPTRPQREAARRALRLPEDAYVVGTVGHLSRDAQVMTLIEAMPAVVARQADARLVVCGEGPEHEALMARVGELGLAERIICCPRSDDPPAVLHAFDAFVTLAPEPSGSCRRLVEAMACGLPAVAPKRTGAVDAGIHHVLRVEPRPRAVAEALLELARSAAWRHELGAEARRFAAAHFDLDVTVRLLEAAYGHCVGRTPMAWRSRPSLSAS